MLRVEVYKYMKESSKVDGCPGVGGIKARAHSGESKTAARRRMQY